MSGCSFAYDIEVSSEQDLALRRTEYVLSIGGEPRLIFALTDRLLAMISGEQAARYVLETLAFSLHSPYGEATDIRTEDDEV